MSIWNERGDSMSKVNASIKYGKGYDEPWITFEGEDPQTVRGLIISAFSLDVAEDISLSTVVSIASQSAQGVQSVSTTLGATAVEEVKTNDVSDSHAAVRDGGEPAADAGGDPVSVSDPYAGVAEQFANAGSIDELRALWAKHKDAYSSSESVRQAYKSRGQALKSA